MTRLVIWLLSLALSVGCGAHYNGAVTLRDLISFREVVRQRFETSCGAASLATVLTHFFREPTTESEILNLIVPDGRAPDRGLSLEDLKRAAVAKGYRTASHEVDLSLLLALPEPAIVVLCPSGKCPPNTYHFSVFQGGSESMIQLADPSRGRLVIGTATFTQMWSGIILILGKDGERNHRFFRPPTHPAVYYPSAQRLPR